MKKILTKISKFRIPIFTEEYAVNVYFGDKESLEREAPKYLGHPITWEGHRGRAYNCFPDKQPLILIDKNLHPSIQIACLAHEACHAADYIMEYLSLDDRSGEFRAHVIGAVMRSVAESFVKDKSP